MQCVLLLDFNLNHLDQKLCGLVPRRTMDIIDELQPSPRAFRTYFWSGTCTLPPV